MGVFAFYHEAFYITDVWAFPPMGGQAFRYKSSPLKCFGFNTCFIFRGCGLFTSILNAGDRVNLQSFQNFVSFFNPGFPKIKNTSTAFASGTPFSMATNQLAYLPPFQLRRRCKTFVATRQLIDIACCRYATPRLGC
jgi:hypothetical protein